MAGEPTIHHRISGKALVCNNLRDIALWSTRIARECHLQIPGSRLISWMSSSGGGLPGRLDLERDRGARYFWLNFLPVSLSLEPSRSSRCLRSTMVLKAEECAKAPTLSNALEFEISKRRSIG